MVESLMGAYMILVGGVFTSGGLAMFGVWLLGQSGFTIDDLPTLGTGSVVIVGAALLIRWTVSTAERVEARYLSALERAETEIGKCRDRCADLETAAQVWEQKYWEEWRLRTSLEQAGVVDRRNPPDRPDGQ